MKNILLLILFSFSGFYLFSQTEVKVPQLSGTIVTMYVSNAYCDKATFTINDGKDVSFVADIKTRKDDCVSQTYHAIANAMEQIVEQKYKLHSTENVGGVLAIYYFVKE